MSKIFEILNSRAVSTPDIQDLKSEHGDLIPVFIYDNMMKGYPDSYALDLYPYYGEATTLGDDFVFARKTSHSVHEGMFMMMFATKEVRNELRLVNSNVKRVQGELYGLPLDMIYYLDSIFDNEGAYERCQIPVVLNQQQDKIVRNAHVYIANISHWKYSKKPNYEMLVTGTYEKSKYLMNESVYHSPLKKGH